MSKVIYCDTSDLKKLLKDVEGILSPQTTHAAMAAALNRTLTFVGAETKRQVQAEYAVTKSIQKALTKEKATRTKLTAAAIYKGKPIPLFVFKHTAPNNRFRSPVTVTIKKSNGAQTHTGSNPAMFKAYGNKIKLRDSGQRNLRGAYSVSIPQMVASDDVYDVIAKKSEEYLYKRLHHELEWRVSKL